MIKKIKKIFKKILIKCYEKYSNKELEKKLFVKNLLLYEIIARSRKIGQRKEYRKYIKEPVNKKMFFFESNLAKQYTGNPRYIYEKMLELYPDFDYVWAYNGNPNCIPGNPTVVERGSEKYYELMSKSRYLINNTVFKNTFFRKETIYLQTWHGTPLKKLHYDRTNVDIEKRESASFYLRSRSWSCLLSPNNYSTKIFKSAFKYNGQILEFGYPANDVFSIEKKYEKVRNKIRNELQISNEKKVILYAPTWRDGHHIENYMFDFNLEIDIENLLKQLGKNVIILIRGHHMSASEDVLRKLPKQAINVSHWDDATELMCAADILITDYSSIIYDWYCSKKPVLYYVPDLDNYLFKRPIYYNFKNKYNIPFCQNQSDLELEVKNILNGNYTFDKQFYNDFCSLNDGNAAQRVIDYLLSK
ncbi:CDP-glycerol glycerophosphotransferase (TagB/SpsB family) [Bacilli bacterium PM5-3]|nr:CDP-glycerol glycerophosphotransferase (TagB/SpsB family) [Bacilli bacterium PM5-3]